MADILAIGAIVGGTTLEVSEGLKEGKRAAKAGKYQQLAFERQAVQTERAGLTEQQRLKEFGRQLKGQQIVSVAARGGTLSGTSAKAIVASAAAIEADAFTIARNTQFTAATLRYQGALARYRGRLARRGSRVRAFTTIAKAAGGLALSGALSGGGGGKDIGATVKGASPSFRNPAGIIEASARTGISGIYNLGDRVVNVGRGAGSLVGRGLTKKRLKGAFAGTNKASKLHGGGTVRA